MCKKGKKFMTNYKNKTNRTTNREGEATDVYYTFNIKQIYTFI